MRHGEDEDDNDTEEAEGRTMMKLLAASIPPQQDRINNSFLVHFILSCLGLCCDVGRKEEGSVGHSNGSATISDCIPFH